MKTLLLFLAGIGILELVILLLLAALWLWAVIDLIKSKFQNPSNKIIWAFIIFLIPFLGSWLYLMIGRKQKKVSP